jgi:hypothetical protein
MGDDSDGGPNETSSYNRFKTANELTIEEAYKTGPDRLTLDELDEIIPFGTIVQYI